MYGSSRLGGVNVNRLIGTDVTAPVTSDANFISTYFINNSTEIDDCSLLLNSLSNYEYESFPVFSSGTGTDIYNETGNNAYLLEKVKRRHFTMQNRLLGKKGYELTNHLGNVLAVISDRKIQVQNTSNTSLVDYFLPDVISMTDYYAFGSMMPGRNLNSNNYPFGFNSQEKDNEIYGDGNAYTAMFWEYDPRLGRRWNVDPEFDFGESVYLCLKNNPISYIDPFGNSAGDYLNKKGEKIGTDNKPDCKVYVVNSESENAILENNGIVTEGCLDPNSYYELPTYQTRREIFTEIDILDLPVRFEIGGVIYQSFHYDPNTNEDWGEDEYHKRAVDGKSCNIETDPEINVMNTRDSDKKRQPLNPYPCTIRTLAIWHTHPDGIILNNGKVISYKKYIEKLLTNSSGMTLSDGSIPPYIINIGPSKYDLDVMKTSLFYGMVMDLKDNTVYFYSQDGPILTLPFSVFFNYQSE